jgi:HPt (histidine-containing phosphotransfer) domain-containing protein
MPDAGNGNLLAFIEMDDCNDASTQPHQNVPDLHALSETIYASFESMLTPQQIGELYGTCLDDVDRRIRLLQETVAEQDIEAYRRATHSIKGTCGMVGALRLAALASSMESASLPQPGDLQPFGEFLLASAELRRILQSKSIPLSPSAGSDTL